MAKMCTVSRLERQFATLYLFPPPPLTLGPATTQNLVVKFDGEICGGVLVENSSDDFPSKRSSKISFQTSPEVRHQFRPNFANFTLEIAGAPLTYCGRKIHIKKKHVSKNFTGLSRDFGGNFVYVFFLPHKE